MKGKRSKRKERGKEKGRRNLRKEEREGKKEEWKEVRKEERESRRKLGTCLMLDSGVVSSFLLRDGTLAKALRVTLNLSKIASIWMQFPPTQLPQ